MSETPHSTTQSLIRSFLFVPANHPDKVAKVFHYGADAVILDLEDACAEKDKAASRAVVVEALKNDRPCKGYVRVNAIDTSFCFRDLDAVVGPWLDGIVIPKIERAEELYAVDYMVGQYEQERDLPHGSIDLMPIIETGLGANLDEICAVQSASGAFFRSRGLHPRHGHQMERMRLNLPTRARMIHIARVHNLEAPIDTVHIDLADEDSFAASVATGVKFGFRANC